MGEAPSKFDPSSHTARDSGLAAVCSIAGYYRVAADPERLSRELALGDNGSTDADLVRAAARAGLKARIVSRPSSARLKRIPVPAIARSKAGDFVIFGGPTADGKFGPSTP
jgi:subfamily B ATP-binding cassette protein HlyB/CyaB